MSKLRIFTVSLVFINTKLEKIFFHFNMQKVVEKFLTGPQYINILVIEFKEIGVVSIG